jgi:hypothetical protein
MKIYLLIFALGLALVGCDPQAVDTHPKLAGTWLEDRTLASGGHFKCILQVGPSGAITNLITITGPASEQSLRWEGTWEIKDGVLIETITKDSQPNAPVPRVFRPRIVRMTARELVLKYENHEFAVTLTKLSD